MVLSKGPVRGGFIFCPSQLQSNFGSCPQVKTNINHSCRTEIFFSFNDRARGKEREIKKTRAGEKGVGGKREREMEGKRVGERLRKGREGV